MPTKTIRKNSPSTPQVQQPAPAKTAGEIVGELREKRYEIYRQTRKLERDALQLELQRGIAQGEVNPLPEITITPEETQAVSEHLYWSEGLVSATRDAVSTLRGAMEIVQNEVEQLDPGGPEAKYGEVDVWDSYHPLYGVAETLDLVIHRLFAVSNHLETAEQELPEQLQETKKVAEEAHRYDFGE